MASKIANVQRTGEIGSFHWRTLFVPRLISSIPPRFLQATQISTQVLSGTDNMIVSLYLGERSVLTAISLKLCRLSVNLGRADPRSRGLNCASGLSRKEIIKYLLELGAKPNDKANGAPKAMDRC